MLTSWQVEPGALASLGDTLVKLDLAENPLLSLSTAWGADLPLLDTLILIGLKHLEVVDEDFMGNNTLCRSVRHLLLLIELVTNLDMERLAFDNITRFLPGLTSTLTTLNIGSVSDSLSCTY